MEPVIMAHVRRRSKSSRLSPLTLWCSTRNDCDCDYDGLDGTLNLVEACIVVVPLRKLCGWSQV
jgi:hypothetical protein